mmetsp:Transcript_47699/g.152331  ORF Transcript_47699/g.152331 Transcript_47699/m.152331 type:complete len:254 (-) Transcript_47699:74-835(-)
MPSRLDYFHAAVLNVVGVMCLSACVSGNILTIHHLLFGSGLIDSFQVCIGDVCFKAHTQKGASVHKFGAIVALAGLSFTLGLMCVVVHWLALDLASRRGEVSRVRRQLLAAGPLAPRPSTVLLQGRSLREAALGECSICFEGLCSPAVGHRIGLRAAFAGPLRLPCGHTFHEACVRRWIVQDRRKTSAASSQRTHTSLEGRIRRSNKCYDLCRTQIYTRTCTALTNPQPGSAGAANARTCTRLVDAKAPRVRL